MVTEPLQIYPKRFFELQLIFAQKVAQLSRQPLAETVLQYTGLYRLLGLDWSLDPTHPVWQAYLQETQRACMDADRTYQFYLQRYHEIPRFTDQAHWGCFAYEYHADTQAIRLHFSSQDTSGYGALSSHQRAVRIAELRAMFRHIQQAHPGATLVHGGSWLYHRESYRRLFPTSYGQSAQVVETPSFAGRALWGQFLRGDWQVNEETTSLFLQHVGRLEEVERCVQCFPYPVLKTAYPILAFYAFYGI